jgi:type VI secretion system protein ImpB
MAKDVSVAPRERINIVYKPATGDAQEEMELPLRLMVLGDFTGKPSDEPLEDSNPINIDKSNFNDVLAKQNIGVQFTVPDRISGEEGAEMAVNLKFESINDFHPENIVRQVPELNKLLELREALVALKGPLGNVPAFRKTMQSLLSDDDSRSKLMKELGLEDKGGD